MEIYNWTLSGTHWRSVPLSFSLPLLLLPRHSINVDFVECCHSWSYYGLIGSPEDQEVFRLRDKITFWHDDRHANNPRHSGNYETGDDGPMKMELYWTLVSNTLGLFLLLAIHATYCGSLIIHWIHFLKVL